MRRVKLSPAPALTARAPFPVRLKSVLGELSDETPLAAGALGETHSVIVASVWAGFAKLAVTEALCNRSRTLRASSV